MQSSPAVSPAAARAPSTRGWRCTSTSPLYRRRPAPRCPCPRSPYSTAAATVLRRSCRSRTFPSSPCRLPAFPTPSRRAATSLATSKRAAPHRSRRCILKAWGLLGARAWMPRPRKLLKSYSRRAAERGATRISSSSAWTPARLLIPSRRRRATTTTSPQTCATISTGSTRARPRPRNKATSRSKASSLRKCARPTRPRTSSWSCCRTFRLFRWRTRSTKRTSPRS
mmetsp:Transcript_16916/g.57249  ORF Transcript_16916/g.57249 Transcript_16916/m.57249 type:complete len:226 (+) Transcript_16916:499-1176(+)